MPRFDTPDTLIGIGGAGKEIVYQMMEPPDEEEDDPDEWILEEVMEPRPGDDSFDRMLEAYVVESEQEEKETADVPRCNRINDRISRLADEYDEAVPEPQIQYVNVVERARTEGHQLVADSVVRDFASDTSLNCWWYDGDEIDTNENYSNGVDRRRSLGKALYYASRADPDPIREIVGTANAGQRVDIVVGLGGGTGSGMFLDLARLLHVEADVNTTLFGVLPKDNEDEDVMANAYAALSELEYLAITEQNPFDNIVLLPYAPADDKQEFDEAVVHTILAHNNIRSGNIKPKLDESMDRGPSKYAPFTLAVPQIVRYDAPGIRQSRENFRSYRDEKADIRETELDLYDSVASFLEVYYEDAHRELSELGSADEYRLREEELDDLDQRLETVETLLNLDELARSGYDAAPEIAEALNDLEADILGNFDVDEDSPERRKRIVVDELPDSFVEMDYGRPPGGFDRTEDRELYELVVQHLETLRRRRETLRAKNMLDAGEVRNSLTTALDTDRPGAAGRRSLDDEIDERSREIAALETEESDVERVRRHARSRLRDALDSCEDDVQRHVEQLVALETHREELFSLLDDLEAAINAATAAINDAGAEGVQIGGVDFDEFERLNQKLDAVGVDTLSEPHIDNSVRNARMARQAWIDDEHAGVFDALKRVFADTTPAERYLEAAEAVGPDVIELPEWGPSGGRFAARATARNVRDRRTRVEERREELVDEVVRAVDRHADPALTVDGLITAVSEDLDSPEEITVSGSLGVDVYDYRSSLESELSSVGGQEPDAVRSTLFDEGDTRRESERRDAGEVYRVFADAYLGPFDSRLHTLGEKLDQLRSEREQFSRLLDIHKMGQKLANKYDGHMEPESIPESGGSDESGGQYVTIKEAQDRGLLLGRADIEEAGLWETERTHITRELQNIATLVDQRTSYCPLETGNVTHRDASPTDYQEFVVAPVYMSRVFDRPVTDDDAARVGVVHGTLRDGSINLSGGGKYKPRRIKFGGPWDISMTVFVGGVMLDNLRPFRGAYRDAYQRERAKLDSGFVRHVHGLDGNDYGTHNLFEDADGAFLHRAELLDIHRGAETTRDGKFLLDATETGVVERLLDCHEFERFSSTVTLGETTTTGTETGSSEVSAASDETESSAASDETESSAASDETES